MFSSRTHFLQCECLVNWIQKWFCDSAFFKVQNLDFVDFWKLHVFALKTWLSAQQSFSVCFLAFFVVFLVAIFINCIVILMHIFNDNLIIWKNHSCCQRKDPFEWGFLLLFCIDLILEKCQKAKSLNNSLSCKWWNCHFTKWNVLQNVWQACQSLAIVSFQILLFKKVFKWGTQMCKFGIIACMPFTA